MVRGVKKFIVALAIVILAIPALVEARAVHYFNCNDCHRQGMTLFSLSANNLCLKCHSRTGDSVSTNDIPSKSAWPNGRFNDIDASNAMGSHPTYNPVTATATSHMWAVMSESNPAAGAQSPTLYKYQFDGRYGVSRGKVICNRCHNPHGVDTYDKKILKVDNSRDQMCRDCHLPWATSDPNAFETHPMVADYNSVVTANPAKFQAGYNSTTGRLDNNAGDGDVRLLYNSASGKYMVSCSSCHGVHFTDSNSSTVDGYNSTMVGDGKLLRSDGPESVDASPVTQAQLRSNLCQTCHTYKLHGDPTVDADGDGILDEPIGCLDCHGGHSYNGGDPNYYMLRGLVDNRVGSGITYNVAMVYNSLHELDGGTTQWSDLPYTSAADGYCERCHGDIASISSAHVDRKDNDCKECHIHFSTDASHTFSFALDPNAAVCGECHGTPPYKNAPGRNTAAGYQKDGYAYLDASHNYSQFAGYFNESTTAHLTHAGGGQAGGTANDYRFGGSDSAACEPCHGLGDNPNRTHYTGSAPGSYQDVFDGSNTLWSVLSTANGNLSPAYKTANPNAYTCSNTYCHSNGFPRIGPDAPNRNYGAGAIMTPIWNNGDNFIQSGANGARCQFCHGNDENTMGTLGNNPNPNSAAHIKHLQKGFLCNVCHVDTAPDNTSVYNAATLVGNGGTHVNGTVDVAYPNSGSALYNALGVNGSGPLYDSNLGTCSVYCHDPDDTGNTADWDSAASMQCYSCHNDGTAGTQLANAAPNDTSHDKHLRNADGPQLGSCTPCHGGTDTGDHTGHVNGNMNEYDTTAGAGGTDPCLDCHGWDSGEKAPVWNETPYNSAVPSERSEYCITCHTGTNRATVNGRTAPNKTSALGTGHNYNSATPYPVTGNSAADKQCDSCHNLLAAGHFNGAAGEDRLKTNFACENCHTTSGAGGLEDWTATEGQARVVKTHSNMDAAYTGQKRTDFTKACLACHDPHGTSNIAMIYDLQSEQVAKDPDYLGGGNYNSVFSGDVVMVRFNSATLGDGFDENDAANGDDICATCHVETTHNNSTATGAHKEGLDCRTCHQHDGPNGGWMPNGGTQCNDCHGFPPLILTERATSNFKEPGAHALHTRKSTDLPSEDRSDCDVCHPGAGTYALDHSDGGPINLNSLIIPSGLDDGNYTCNGMCHNSTLADGYWADPDGLNCDACHYYVAGLTTPSGLSARHDKHFDSGKGCIQCHDLASADYNSGSSIVGPLAHINEINPADTDLQQLQDKAQAVQDEAGFDEGGGLRDVKRSGMTYSDLNTCSGGITTGCHATGSSPGWDAAFPADGTRCVLCHTDTTNTSFNPTSGLHGGPLTVTGNSHDDSFDDGVSPTGGTCDDCHTLSPSLLHADGTRQTTAQTITIAGSVGFSDNGTPADPSDDTCANTCHSAGTNWSYLWSDTAKLNTGEECNNCHGTFANSWNAGTVHATYPTRGGAHGSTGGLSYACTDCHAIGASTNVYTFASGTADWNPATGETSSHGDGTLQMNYNSTNFSDDNTWAGCAGTGCHGTDANHRFTSVSGTTNWALANVTGDVAQVSCSGCHGNDIGGTSKNNYWPDGLGGNLEDDLGAHTKHMTALALKVYGESVAQLLTDNGNGTADAKQKELCQYCHVLGDGDHGDPLNLPAETLATANDTNTAGQGFYPIWQAPRTARDSADYDTTGNGSCYVSDCHNTRATDVNATNYGWYAGNGSACEMCHDPNNVTLSGNAKGVTHLAHTGASTNFGRNITCDDCHKTASETIAWGTPGTAPTNNHINGALTVTGTVSFTYSAGSCGINACHNAGDGVTAPATGTYPWGGGALADCTICHTDPPTTGAHTPHKNNTAYVACVNCHTPATNAAHIGGSVTYNTVTVSAAPGDGSCTNTCHVAGTAGDWTGGSAVMACADCHSGTYVGGGAYLPASGLHAVTAANVTKHDATLTGGCEACHTAYGSEPASHVDGIWQADGAANTESRFVSRTGMTYNEQAVNSSTCSGTGGLPAGTCHSDGGNWARLWSTDANTDYVTSPNPGQAVCNVCHGLFASIANSTGWRTGTVHATSGATKGSGHTDANPDECEDCHGYDSAISHEDGFITMSGDTNAVLTTGEDYQLTWGNNATNPGWYCETCHNGDMGDDALTGTTHTFVDSSAFPSPTKVPTHEKIRYVNGVSSPEGGCTGCHGNTGTGGYWPDGSRGGVRVAGSSGPADNVGAHIKHVNAIGDRINGGGAGSATVTDKNATCSYCHPNPGGGGHNDASAPADMHDGTTTYFKHISGTTDDAGSRDGVAATYNSTTQKCSNLDCHNGIQTPGWYSFDGVPTTAPLTSGVLVNSSSSATVTKGATITIDATVSDANGGAHNVTAAEWKLDAGGTWTSMDAFTPGVTVPVTATGVSTGAWSPGEHWIYVRGYDATDGWGQPAAVPVTVQGQDSLSVTWNNINPTNIEQGKRVKIARLDLASNAVGDGKVIVDRIQVHRTGTGADSDVARVEIFNDAGFSSPGTFGDDDGVIGSGVFSGGAVDINVVNLKATNGSTTSVYIVYNVDDAAATSKTLGASVAAADVTVVSPDLVSAFSASTVSPTTIDPAPSGGGTNTYFFDYGGVCKTTYSSAQTVTLGAVTGGGCNGTSKVQKTVSGKEDFLMGYLNNGGYANDYKILGQATGSDINLLSTTAANGYVELVEVDPGNGNIVQVLDTLTVPLAGGVTSNVTNLSALGGVVRAGYTFGINVAIDAGQGTVTWGRDGFGAGSEIWSRVNEAPATSIAPNTYNARVSDGGAYADTLTVIQGASLTLKADMSTNDGEAITGGQYRIDGGSWNNITSPDVGGWDSASESVTVSPIDTSSWTTGSHTIDVRAIDSDGNGRFATVNVTVTLGSTVYVNAFPGVPPNVRRGATLKMIKLSLYTGAGTTVVDSFTVDMGVTEDFNDVDMVYIYHDDGDGAFDANLDHVIGSSDVTGLSTVVSTAPITVGATNEDFYVVYVISTGATENNQVSATVTAIGISADDALAGGALPVASGTTQITFGLACGDCHTIPRSSGAHAKHANSDSDFTECMRCHTTNAPYGYTTNPNGTHNNGQRTLDPALGFTAVYPAKDGTCANIDCHYNQPATPVWEGGLTQCDSCHGYPPAAGSGLDHTSTGSYVVDDNAFMLGHDDCLFCHGRKATDFAGGNMTPVYNQNYKPSYHADGNIVMNGPTPSTGAGYNSVNHGCDIACHPNSASYQMAANGSGFGLNNADFGFGCTGCHNTSTQAANVWYGKGHTDTTGYTCKTCHWAHEQGEVIIPNYPAVGIDFSANGETGISLGSPLVPGYGTATSEAEYCWACHDANGVSEWGTNTNTSGKPTAYNYGQIYSDAGTTNPTSNWIGAYWKSYNDGIGGTADFSYKTGQIQSTHTGNKLTSDYNPAGAGLDPVDKIRCSYCHDVHETNQAPGDTFSGKPFLRGTWKGSPYREDGAPQAGMTWTTVGNFGAVPRGGTAAVELGGYQIDQNNGNPTSGWTAIDSAGICILCHGNDVDNMNYFGVDSDAWVGTNGHANATLAGSGDAGIAANIFTIANRNGASGAPIYTGDGSSGGTPSMAYRNRAAVHPDTSRRGYGFRSNNSGGFQYTPSTGAAQPYASNDYNWGATVDDATTDTRFHAFSCSKCHNPHASRLPRLMITNCLDTKHNAWDNPGNGVTVFPASDTNTGGSSLSPENQSVQLSNATSAQNCHRVRDPQFGKSSLPAGGWNLVTPWTPGVGQDNPGIQ